MYNVSTSCDIRDPIPSTASYPETIFPESVCCQMHRGCCEPEDPKEPQGESEVLSVKKARGLKSNAIDFDVWSED